MSEAHGDEHTLMSKRLLEDIVSLLPLDLIRTELLNVLPSDVIGSDLALEETADRGVDVTITLRGGSSKAEVMEAIENGVFVSRVASGTPCPEARTKPCCGCFRSKAGLAQQVRLRLHVLDPLTQCRNTLFTCTPDVSRVRVHLRLAWLVVHPSRTLL